MKENKMRNVKQILIERDGMTEQEADALIADYKRDFQQVLDDGGDYEEACMLMEDYFGLEPDYIEEFI